MNVTATLVGVTGLLFAFAAPNHAQTLTASVQQPPRSAAVVTRSTQLLRDALDAFQKKYGVSVLYNSELIEGKTVVTAEKPAPSPDVELDRLLASSGLSSKKLRDGVYVITAPISPKTRTLQPITPSSALPNKSLSTPGAILASIQPLPLPQSQPLPLVKGTVMDAASGEPLPGVNVVVKGTATGSVTDKDGAFSIRAGETSTLVFSFVGYRSQEVAVGGRTTLTIRLLTAPNDLDEVVVTALGVVREKRDLGFAVQEVQGDKLTQARETNVLNALSGRVAGVQVTNSSGGVGSSARLVIRGESILGGNSQPLFVVDGVPIDNGNYKSGSFRADAGGQGGAIDFGNAASDLNPDDIETISVLKGPNAAALYGSRAANGVVLITTKSGKGKKGIGVTINSNATFERPLRLPEYQNQYGQGSGGKFSYKDGRGGGVGESNASWGPRLDAGLEIPQFFSGGQPAPWVSQPNNVRNFFETGTTFTNNLALTGGNDKSDFRLSMTNLRQQGMIPNTDLERNTIALNGGAQLSTQLRAQATVNYIRNESDNRPGAGYDILNPMRYFGWFGRNVDLNRLKNYRKPDGGILNWNDDGFHSNIYFLLNENTNAHRRERVNGNLSLTYKPLPWLSLLVRTGTDFYNESRKLKRAQGNNEYPQGSYREDIFYVNERNTDFLLDANRQVASGLTLNVSLGGNQMRRVFERNSAEATQLTVAGLYNFSNAQGPVVTANFQSEKRINSLYGTARLAYRNQLFLELTGRNDWSSTLPPANNSYFYPSVSLSWVLTDALQLKGNTLSFAKLRTSWAQVGSDTEPYQLAQTASGTTPWGSTSAFTLANRISNYNLKPQLATGYEAGADVRFFQDRLRLDVTYYYKSTRNQILNASIANSSGFSTRTINAGEIRNTGVEAILNVTPLVRANGLRWDVDINWSQNNNRVISLAEGIETFTLDGLFRMNVRAKVGEPYGSLFGTGFKRDPQGNIIYDKGLPVTDPNARALGNYTPDWIGGIYNTLTYKGWSFGFLVDVRKGGNLYSGTQVIGMRAGVLKESLVGRENDAVGQIVGQGVIANNDGTFRLNDVSVSAEAFYNTYYGYANAEAAIFDASFVKLREARLSYSLPAAWLRKVRLTKATLSVVGRNLWLIHSKVPHIDPENAFASDYSQGIEYGSLPSARSMGVNLNLSF